MEYEDGYLDGYKQAIQHVQEYLRDEMDWITHVDPHARDYIQAIDKMTSTFKAWSLEVEAGG